MAMWLFSVLCPRMLSGQDIDTPYLSKVLNKVTKQKGTFDWVYTSKNRPLNCPRLSKGAHRLHSRILG